MSAVSLQDRVAVVTGGNRGIGFAIAQMLLEAGMKVVISGRVRQRVDEAVDRLTAAGGEGRVAGVVCDVQDLDQVTALMSTAAARFGGIDVLVNNAGYGVVVPFDQMTVEQWRRTIDTNLNGVFYCCHAALPWLKKGPGQIVNISSRSGKNPFPGGAAYNASKFGLNGFSEALVLDLRSLGIRVSYVMPGRVNTDFADEAPQPWHIPVEDVARAVLHCLTADSRVLLGPIDLRPSQPGGA